jgi:hypothetical protein
MQGLTHARREAGMELKSKHKQASFTHACREAGEWTPEPHHEPYVTFNDEDRILE